MKKLFAALVIIVFMVVPAFAGPNFSAGGGGGSLTLTIATDCSAVTAEGSVCWDSDNDTLYIGNGAAAVAVGPGSSAGDVTDVFGCTTGNCSALVAAAGDSLNMSSGDSSVPWVAATDCSAVVAEGRACWDTDDNILYIGDGATQIKVLKSGAVVNADLGAAAAIAFSKLAALPSAQILVGNGSNVATAVAVSGDVTIANTGAITIGDDKILEKHLKAVNAASDEDILTYEATTGDFEWHSIGNRLDLIGSTRGSILERGASGWAAITPGTTAYPLLSAGAGADPAYGQITAAGITNDTITATQLAATLTLANGDLLDLSGILHGSTSPMGLKLPTWANNNPSSGTGYTAWDTASKSIKVYDGGWIGFAAVAAPVDPTYLTLNTNATLTNERVLTEGTAIDFVDAGAGSTLTINFDSTELGTTTWGSGAAIVWTFDASGGTDPTFTFGNNLTTIASGLTVTTGKNIILGTTQWNSGDKIDGTKVADADLGGIGVSSGVWTIENDSHSHTSSTLPATTAYTDAANQVFTGALQTFGDADTDQLKVRSMIYGGNSREVQINAGTRTAPSNPSATPTQDLYVKGNVEVAGTIYGAAFNGGAGTEGQRRLSLTNNTAFDCATYPNSVYFIGDALYYCQSTAAKTPMRLEDAQTASGVKSFTNGVYLGDASTQGLFRMYDGSSNYWIIQAPTGMSGNYTMTLPGDDGTTGQALLTDGSGVLSWGSASATAAGAAAGMVQYNATGSGGALAASAHFIYTEPSAALLTIGSEGTGKTGNLALAYEGGANDYTATIAPNSSMAADITVTLPASSGTLINTTGANAWTGVQTFSGSGTLTSPPITTAITPISAGGATLGTTALEWGHLYLTDSAIIYGQANQGNTITSSATGWTFNNPVTFGPQTTTAGSVYFQEGSGGGTDTTQLIAGAPVGNVVVTLPIVTSTLATLGANALTGAQTFTGSGVLTSPPITTDIHSTAAGGSTLGTALLPFSDIYISGTSGTPATNHFKITGSHAVGAEQVITLPSVTSTLATLGANALTGAQTFTGSGGLTSPPITTDIRAASAGGATVGTALLPFSSVYIGGSATNNVQLTAISAAARIVTIPDIAAASTLLVTDATTTTAGGMPLSTTTAGKHTYLAGGAAGTILAGAGTTSNPTYSATPSLTTSLTVPLINLGTGISLTGGAGVVTFTDLAGTSEVLAIDLRTADTAKLTTTSGITSLDIGALNFVTTGQISGRVPVVADNNGKTLSGTDLYGSMQLATGAGTWVIPDVDAAAGTGQCFCIYATGAYEIVIDGNAEDKIRLAGTLGAAGGDITNNTAEAAGDFICLMLTDFASDVAHWTTLGYKGTWTVVP